MPTRLVSPLAGVPRLPSDAAVLQGSRAAPPLRAAAAAPAAARRLRTRCLAASTEQGRGRRPKSSAGSSSSGGGDASSSSSSSSSGERSSQGSSSRQGDGGRRAEAGGSGSDPALLRRIAACGSAQELLQLLSQHSSELGGREVAAALELTAKRRLLPAGRTSASSGGGGDGSAAGHALGAALVRLAQQHAPGMQPAEISASAWSLAVLRLSGARAAVKAMQLLAEPQLLQYSPAHLCALLWAGCHLDPQLRSPLFAALSGLIERNLSLDLFTSRDLSVLMWLCGRNGGAAARDVSKAVAAECSARVQAFAATGQQGGTARRKRGRPRRSAAGSAGSSSGSEGSGSEGSDGEGLAAAPPLPPFAPADAAMLLTGLAQQQLRVGGLVEPLARQCVPQLEAAQPNDVARIIIALGELEMELGVDRAATSSSPREPMVALMAAACAVHDKLSPQQVAAILWSIVRLAMKDSGLHTVAFANRALKHYQAHGRDYQRADTIGLLWGVSHVRAVPDNVLVAALASLQPELPQCSTSALCNLLWALGTNAEAVAQSPGHPQPLSPGTAAGAARLAAAELAVAELAQRAQQMQAADLAEAATALAVHPPLAAAVQPGSVAALKDACCAALEADSFLSLDLGQVAAAAARLRWADRAFVDALAGAVPLRINLHTTTGQAFSQCLRALASLAAPAPARFADLFTHMAGAYCEKMRVEKKGPGGNYLSTFLPEEKAGVLGAFAAVAPGNGLARAAIPDLLASVYPTELRQLSFDAALALLVLAVEAKAPADERVVEASLSAIERRLNRLGLDSLRQAQSALRRLKLQGSSSLAFVIHHRIGKLEGLEQDAAAGQAQG